MKTILINAVSATAVIVLAACGPSSDMKGTDGKTMSGKGEMKGMESAPAPKQEAKTADSGMPKGEMKGMDQKSMPMEGKPGPHQASASVKSVDVNTGMVTLDHGPVSTMNWPAMTMSFKIKDKAMLEKLAVGSRVEVEFVQQGGDYVITGVK